MSLPTSNFWKSTHIQESDYQNFIISLNGIKTPFKNPFGQWVVSDYELVREMLKDKERIKVFDLYERVKFISEHFEGSYNSFAESLKCWILFMEGEEHAQYRKLLNQHVYKADIEKIIQEETDVLIEELKTKTSFDIIKDFTAPFIVRVMARIANIPLSEAMMMRDFSNILLRVFEPDTPLNLLQQFDSQVQGFEKMITEQIKPYDFNELNTFWNGMTKTFGRERWSELFSLVEFFTISGVETSMHLIGRSIFTLIEQKELLNQYLSPQTDVEIAHEELIRYICPVTYLIRSVRQDCNMGQTDLIKGERIYLCMAAANREESIFPNPHEIQLDRNPNPHISFGYSTHYCIGAKLARMEMNYALPAFFKAFPNLKIEEKSVVYEPKVVFRGLRNALVLN
jgi:cytochrome P450